MSCAATTATWPHLKEFIERHQYFVLTCHLRPDCDALGSELAMAEVLTQLGKQVRIINADEVPPRLAFVDPDRRIEMLPEGATTLEPPVDAIIVLDTAAWGQLGRMADVIRRSTVEVAIIDHHANPGEVPGLLVQDSSSEATGRLIADFARYLGVDWTVRLANALFVAIATDTGWFRFACTRSSTYEVAGQLVAAGASPPEIFRQLYERDSLSRAKLRGIVLTRIILEMGGQVAHTYVRDEDFQQTGALRSETDDFINMALAIEGVGVAAMFTEHPVGTIKVSLRSRMSLVDCSRVTEQFGGGGHRAAAGATLLGELADVRTRVLAALRSALAS
jgi:phosphoesterase RecJ-like protein